MVSDTSSQVQENQSPGNFFQKLSRGDFGLAKTYWLYGVVVGAASRILDMIIPSPVVVALLNVAWIVYAVFLYMGIWKAAGRYTGERGWAILARIMVVIGALFLVLTLVGLFTILES